MGELLRDTADRAHSRPRSVKVFGWLNAILGTIGSVISIAVFVQVDGPMVFRLGVVSPYILLRHFIVLAPFIVLACSGFGLLGLRSWGRNLALTYCGIVFGLDAIRLIGLAVSGVPPLPYPIWTVRFMFDLLYCGLMLFFMTRPHVKAAFEQWPRSIQTSGRTVESGNPYQAP